MINPLIMKPCVTIIQPIAAPTDRAPIFPQNIREGYFSNKKYAANGTGKTDNKKAHCKYSRKKML